MIYLCLYQFIQKDHVDLVLVAISILVRFPNRIVYTKVEVGEPDYIHLKFSKQYLIVV